MGKHKTTQHQNKKSQARHITNIYYEMGRQTVLTRHARTRTLLPPNQTIHNNTYNTKRQQVVIIISVSISISIHISISISISITIEKRQRPQYVGPSTPGPVQRGGAEVAGLAEGRRAICVLFIYLFTFPYIYLYIYIYTYIHIFVYIRIQLLVGLVLVVIISIIIRRRELHHHPGSGQLHLGLLGGVVWPPILFQSSLFKLNVLYNDR